MKAPRKNQESDPLACWMDRLAVRCPDRPAPRSLSTTVLAAIARRSQQPWYTRPWHTWPRAGQILVWALLGTVFGVCCLIGDMWAPVPALASETLDLGRMSIIEVSTQHTLMTHLVHSLGRVVTELLLPWLWILIAGLLVLWMSGFGLATAVWRLARENSHS